MGTTIWAALADAYPDFKRDEWNIDHQNGTTTTLYNVTEPDVPVYVIEISNGTFYVALEE
jgi:hypothetical protein